MDVTTDQQNGNGVDKRQAVQFLTAVFRKEDHVLFDTFDDATRVWFNPVPECDDFESAIDKMDAFNQQGGCVYFGVNPRKKNATGNDGTSHAVCYYADFDGTTPERALQTIREAGLPEPSIVVASGGGTHCYWLLHEQEDDLAIWHERQKWIAYSLGSSVADHIPKPDKDTTDEEKARLKTLRKEVLARNGAADDAVCDIQRLSRVPGFINRKSDYSHCPPQTKLVRCDGNRRFSWKDLQPKCKMPTDGTPQEKRPKRERIAGELLPGDDFDERGAWEEVLGKGWRAIGRSRNGMTPYTNEPNKSRRKTATISEQTDEFNSCIYVWDTDYTALPPQEWHSKFHAYALIHHNGIHAEAAAALAEKGYGHRSEGKEDQPTTAPEKALFASVIGLMQTAEPFADSLGELPPALLSNEVARNTTTAFLAAGDFSTLPAVVSAGGDDVAKFIEGVLPIVTTGTDDQHRQTIRDSIEKLQHAEARRSVGKIAERLQEVAGDPHASLDVVTGLATEAMTTTTAVQSSSLLTGDALADFYFNNPPPLPMPTGFPWWDDVYGGISPGVTVIAGRPGSSKSAFVLQLAAGVMRNTDSKVVWGLGELTPQELIQRLAANHFANYGNEGRVSMDELRDTTQLSTGRIKSVLAFYKDKFSIETNFNLDAIESAVVRTNAKLVVLDYFQVLQLTEQGKERLQQLEEQTARLVKTANERGCAVIVISAMAKGTGDKDEIGSLTKNTGTMDYGAAQYFVSSFDQEADKRFPFDITWRCMKNRYGPTKDMPTTFDGKYQNFTTWMPSMAPGEGFDPSLETREAEANPLVKHAATTFGGTVRQVEKPTAQQEIEDFNAS